MSHGLISAKFLIQIHADSRICFLTLDILVLSSAISRPEFCFEAKFTEHKIHYLKTYKWVAFSLFLKLCNQHLYLVPKHLITSKGNPVPIKQSFCPRPPPLLQALATTNLLSISLDLSILNISYE